MFRGVLMECSWFCMLSVNIFAVKAVPFGKIGNVACSSMSAGWGELVLSFDDEEKAAVTVALRIAVL